MVAVKRWIGVVGLVVMALGLPHCSSDEPDAKEAVDAADDGEKAAAGDSDSDGDEAADSPAPAEAAAPAPALEIAQPLPAPAPPAPPAPTGAAANPSPQLSDVIGYNIGNYLLVAVPKAPVHGGPGNEFAGGGFRQQGDKVPVLERKGTWVRIAEGAWLNEKMLSAFHKAYKVKVASTAVRSRPNHGARVVEHLKQDATVNVEGVSGEWARVGTGRFVLRSAISLVP